MRIRLAQLTPQLGALEANLRQIDGALDRGPTDLLVLPELFLSGYRPRDRLHAELLTPGHPALERLRRRADERRVTIVVGAPIAHPRPGEIVNGAVVLSPGRPIEVRGKRRLPTFGPFDEGAFFTPSDRSEPVDSPVGRLGVEICYDAFFPEVSRDLAMAGASLLVVLSAAPITSRRLFDLVLPARAVENAVPLVYVNRTGVEEGLVFGGGSLALDARGERVPAPGEPDDAHRGMPACWDVEIDLAQAHRWRPFRPVLRDADRPGASDPSAFDAGPRPAPRPIPPGRRRPKRAPSRAPVRRGR